MYLGGPNACIPGYQDNSAAIRRSMRNTAILEGLYMAFLVGMILVCLVGLVFSVDHLSSLLCQPRQ